MPAAIPLGSRPGLRGAPSPGAPPPVPTTGETFAAAFRAAGDVIPFYQPDTLKDAYAPLVDEAVRQTGKPRSAYYTDSWWRIDPLHPTDYGKVLQDLPAEVRQRMGAGDGRAAFEQRVLSRGSEGARDRDVAARGGAVPRFAGGMAGAMTDPANFLTLPVGGIGRSFALRVVTEGLAQAGLTALQMPQNVAARAATGQETSAGDMAAEIAMAGAGGMLFKGAELTAAPAWRAAVPMVQANLAKLPAPLRDRFAARGTLSEPDQDVLLADVVEAVHGKDRMSDAELAATASLRRNGEIDRASPFVADGAGAAAHGRRLSAAMAQLTDGAPPPSRRARLLASTSRPGDAAPRAAAPRPGVDAMWRAIIGNEGGTDRHGNFRTSPKGAIGPAQVMPGTAPQAARLAGVPFDDHRYRTDPAYNDQLGRAYFGEMLRQFGGDPEKAAAAYNAGPGSAERGTGVRGAMARAERAGEPGNWRAYLPAETRNYVRNFNRRSGGAGDDIRTGGAIDDGRARGDEFAALDAEDTRIAAARAALDSDEQAMHALRREAGDEEAFFAGLGTEGERIAAGRSGLDRDSEAAAALRNEASTRGFEDPVAPPFLKRELFADDTSWRVAQSASDAEHLGTEPAVTRQHVWEEARDTLIAAREGEVPGALYHAEVGPIDVKWGDANGGLAKIADKHPEVLDALPALIEQMGVKSRSANRVILQSLDHRAVVSLDWHGADQRWLLSAYKFEGKVPSATVDRGAADGARDRSPSAGTSGDIARDGANLNPAARALQEAAMAEPIAARFGDPAGSDAAAQADTFEHDVRAAIEAGDLDGVTFDTGDGAADSAAVLLAQLDDDAAALEAIRGCL